MTNCPECGNPDLDRDEVDIGVGVQQGPASCSECGWPERRASDDDPNEDDDLDEDGDDPDDDEEDFDDVFEDEDDDDEDIPGSGEDDELEQEAIAEKTRQEGH